MPGQCMPGALLHIELQPGGKRVQVEPRMACQRHLRQQGSLRRNGSGTGRDKARTGLVLNRSVSISNMGRQAHILIQSSACQEGQHIFSYVAFDSPSISANCSTAASSSMSMIELSAPSADPSVPAAATLFEAAPAASALSASCAVGCGRSWPPRGVADLPARLSTCCGVLGASTASLSASAAVSGSAFKAATGASCDAPSAMEADAMSWPEACAVHPRPETSEELQRLVGTGRAVPAADLGQSPAIHSSMASIHPHHITSKASRATHLAPASDERRLWRGRCHRRPS